MLNSIDNFQETFEKQQQLRIPTHLDNNFYKKWLECDAYNAAQSIAIAIGIHPNALTAASWQNGNPLPFSKVDSSGDLILSQLERERIEFIIYDLYAKKQLFMEPSPFCDSFIPIPFVELLLYRADFGLHEIYAKPSEVVKSAYQCMYDRINFFISCEYEDVTGKELKLCSATSPLYEYYHRWSTLPLWELDEAISLVKQIATEYYPACDAYDNSYGKDECTPFFEYNSSAFSQTKRIAERAILAETLVPEKTLVNGGETTYYFKPHYFIDWAKSIDIYPPRLLKEFLEIKNKAGNSGQSTQKQETKLYDDEWPDKGLKPSRKDKERCRALASYFWHIDPSLSVTDMAKKKEIKTFGHGSNYGSRAVEDWIRDLHPRKNQQ